MEHRTLKLTHREISVIQHALGIAAKQVDKVRAEHINTLTGTLGADAYHEGDSVNGLMTDYKNEIENLVRAIYYGDKDA